MNTRWQPWHIIYFMHYELLGLYINYIIKCDNCSHITKFKNFHLFVKEMYLLSLFTRVCRSFKYLCELFFCLECERDTLCFLLRLETHSPHVDVWHAAWISAVSIYCQQTRKILRDLIDSAGAVAVIPECWTRPDSGHHCWQEVLLPRLISVDTDFFNFIQ